MLFLVRMRNNWGKNEMVARIDNMLANSAKDHQDIEEYGVLTPETILVVLLASLF